MKKLGSTVVCACLLFLASACQSEPPKLDTKNAQSLRASIYAITKDMTEPEKVDFTQDFVLLFQHAAFSSKEGMRSFFNTQLSNVIPTSETDESVMRGYSRILIDHPALFTDLDSAQLKEKANAIRSQGYKDEHKKALEKIVSIKSEIDRLKSRIPEITASVEKSKIELIDWKAQRDSILEPLKIKRYQPLGSRAKIEFELTAKHVLDKPVKRYFATLTTTLKDKPDYTATHRLFVTPPRGNKQATSSEVTKITYKPSLFLNSSKRGLGKSEKLPSSLDEYEFSVKMDRVIYHDNDILHWGIIPELETKIANLPKYIQSCERAMQVNGKLAEDVAQYAEQLKTLIENPSQDLKLKQPKAPRVNC